MAMKMRRANQEITERAELTAILDACDVCRLGLSTPDGIPYIVPMNFGYEWTGDVPTLYFHGAAEGKKLDILRQNPNTCFEMDCSHKLLPADAPCDYSMNYESLIGNGTVCFCENNEKIYGLTCIMRKYSTAQTFEFPEKALALTTVLKLTVTEFAGKRLQE